MTSRAPQPPAAQPQISQTPSKYSRAYNSYSRSQIKVVLPFIVSISRTCSHSPLYPICKLLKAVSKIFMLNEIEVVFLAYLIRETSWNINDKTIYHNAENVQDVIYYSNDSADYKRIILYLLVTAFTIKHYLNESSADILKEVNKRCPNFKQIFQSWNKKHSSIITKINPRSLNLVYRKLYTHTKGDELDFNMMVDAIIQISPAYNPEKPAHEAKKKPERKEQDFFLKRDESQAKHEKSLLLPQPSAQFSHSEFMNITTMYQPVGNLYPHDNGSGFISNSALRVENLNIMGASINLNMPSDMQHRENNSEEADQNELNLGLVEGQSEEQILVMEDKTNNEGGTGGVTSSGFQFCRDGHQGALNTSNFLNSSRGDEVPVYTSVISLGRRHSGVILREPARAADSDVGEMSSLLMLGSGFRERERAKKQASVVNLSPGRDQLGGQ